MVVQHNLTAMNSNRMLGLTTSAQAKSTEKLSSGYKINRAADDAAGLSISEKMRKQIRGLSQASLNAEDGISAVQTAEGALNEVQDMLQRMNELAVKASNGTMSESDRSYIQNEIDQLVTEIDRVAETTKFNETYLLKGDNTVDPKATYEYAKKQYTADSVLYDANGNEVAAGTLLDNDATYYTERTATGQDALTNNGAGDLELYTATKVSFGADVYTKDADGNATFIASGEAIAVGTTVYASAEDAAKGENGYTISADDVADGAFAGATAMASTMEAEADKKLVGDLGADTDADMTAAFGGTFDSSKLKYNTTTYTADTATSTAIKANLDANDLAKWSYDGTAMTEEQLNALKDFIGYKDNGTYVLGTMTMEVVEAKAEMNVYTVEDGNATVVNAGESFKMDDVDAGNVFKAVEYTTAGTAVKYDDFADYAKDSQLMDADGNEVAANGLYSYFDKDGNYEGGLYLKDDEGNLKEATKAEVQSFVTETEKETGALTLKLHVGADATTNNQISIELDAMSASSLGIEGLKVDGKDDSNALNAIETIKASIQMVSEQRSALGAVQNRLEHTIANLDNVVENTTAAESQIRDTDMATEMVRFSNNNILAQAGQSMLAQANQSNQGVLSLLG